MWGYGWRILSRVGLTVQDREVDVEAVFDTGVIGGFVSLQIAERLGHVDMMAREVFLTVKGRNVMVGAGVKILGYELSLSQVFGF